MVALQREIEIMKKVNHPNIIHLRGVYEVDKYVFLVMEYVSGGELFDRIAEKEQYSERDAVIVMRKVIESIDYLHKNGIAHRDLKPENILLANQSSDTDIKLADFGLSRMIDQGTMMKTACGTPTYVAPEVLKATGYGTETDLWSCGVVTYILLSGYLPFLADTVPELFDLILAGDYSFPADSWQMISDYAKDFINGLLTVDPALRLTAEQALKHDWIINADKASTEDLGKKRVKEFSKTLFDRKMELNSLSEIQV